jgi:ubiquinone/menaquinone biosynthesis C-methylase UbiE
MDREIQQETFSYYNERAAEYDEVYVGKGPAMRRYANLYVSDAAEISEMVSGFGKGHAIDVACGTGFWAPRYAPNCARITFLDQSESMLSECRARVGGLGLTAAVEFTRGNLFEVELQPDTYDSAMVGFLLSHLTTRQEEMLFRRLREILKPGAELMVIDSLWTKRREGECEKEGAEERTLNDGRRFKIYKRYFERAEFERILEQRSFEITQLYEGDVMIAATAELSR